jgi:hypothetical protein
MPIREMRGPSLPSVLAGRDVFITSVVSSRVPEGSQWLEVCRGGDAERKMRRRRGMGKERPTGCDERREPGYIVDI